MKRIIAVLLIVLMSMPFVFAGGASEAKSEEASTQKNSFSMYGCYVEAEMAGLVELFTKETGVKVNYVRLSAGELQARVEAEKANPQVALILGIGTDVAIAMDDAGLIEHYVPSNIGDIYPEYVDPNGIFVPLHMIVTCFGSNADWLKEHNLKAPTSWEQLLSDDYKNAICWAHPATSGAAYTILSQTIQRLGEEKAFEYLKALDKNVTVYTKAGAAPFTAAGLGECGVAIGYSDNAQTVVDQGYPLVMTYPEEGTGYGITVVSMVKGGPKNEQEAAHKFVEWLIGESAMKLANKNYNQYPLNKNVVADSKMTPLTDIKRMNFDAKLSADTKKDACSKFEAEVRTSANVK